MFHSKNTSNCCLMYVSSAIMDVTRKQSTPNFPKNEHFLSPNTQTYVCVSGGKHVRFLENLACFVFI